MTTNRLARSQPTETSKLTARDWYAMAVEKHHREAAAAWYRRAVELGEINGDGRYLAAGN